MGMHDLTRQDASFPDGVGQLHRRLLAWSDNDIVVDWAYVVICLLLTLMAGLMSGLTLGLLSLDTVELEVLLRSGTPKEQKYARKIMPIVAHSHSLLVTLLMCNAISMEALPLFLDKLADPITAVIVSVTAVLFFGEIIPQSVCSRYGLAIGANLAPFVRALMWLCSPVSWPMGKLLDLLLGPDHHTLFRRRQLKELVSIHAEDAGMGGALTRDEIKVITGALDLTSKVAYRAMTSLDKVFMLSSSDRLDEATLRSVLRSGHSRIPVHRQGDRGDVVGLVLVKELLQYQYRLGSSDVVPVSMLRMRSIPRLPATTPMYDMLRLFQTGRSHIAVLTQPAAGELHRLMGQDPSRSRSRSSKGRGKGLVAAAAGTAGGGGMLGEGRDGRGGGDGEAREGSVAAASGVAQCATDDARSMPDDSRSIPDDSRSMPDDSRSIAAETDGGDGDGDGYGPYNWYYRSSVAADPSYPPSTLDPQDSSGISTAEAPPSGAPEPEPGHYEAEHAGLNGGLPPLPPAPPPPPPPGNPTGAAPMAAMSAVAEAASVREAAAAQAGRRRTRIGLEATSSGPATHGAEAGTGTGSAADGGGAGAMYGGTSPQDPAAMGVLLGSASGGADGGGRGGGGGTYGVGGYSGRDTPRGWSLDRSEPDHEEAEPEEGRPIGIITIEDVIEELIRSEIVDETDRYVDNNRQIRVNPALLAQSLPEHLTKVLAMAGATKKAAAMHLGRSFSGAAGGPFGRRSLAAALGGPASGAASPRDLSIQPPTTQQQHASALRVPLLQAEQLSGS